MLSAFIDEWATSDTKKKDGGVGAAEFLAAMRNNPGASSLTPTTLKNLSKSLKSKKEKLYQLTGHDIYFALKRERQWYQDVFSEVSGEEVLLSSVINNETDAVSGMLPLIMAKAIDEGATMLDCFSVKSEKFKDGLLPTLYGRYGFKKVGEIEWNEKEYLSDHTTADLRDTIAFWKTQGWREGDAYPSLVVMKLDEEAIGGRKGYLQRIVSEGEDSLRGVGATRIAGEEHDSEHGGESSGPGGSGERYGVGIGGHPGDSGRRTRPNNTRQLLLELLSLSKVDRVNLGLDEEKFAKLVSRFGGQPDANTQAEDSANTYNKTLYQLSPEAKEQLLAERKEDVRKAIEDSYTSNISRENQNVDAFGLTDEKTGSDILFEPTQEENEQYTKEWYADVQKAVEEHFLVPDEVLEKFKGEDWADREMRFRATLVLPENQWWFEEAMAADDFDAYVDALNKKQTDEGKEPFDINLQEHSGEDYDWAKRIWDYAHLKSPVQKDREFVKNMTADRSTMISYAKTLRGYLVPQAGKRKKNGTVIYGQRYVYNSWPGVSTKVSHLSYKSTKEEIAAAIELVLRNPHPYRRAFDYSVRQTQEAKETAAGGAYSSYGQEEYLENVGDNLSSHF
jgi:hypothetical protein